jgi:anti-sigma B factor antagonist
MATTLELLESTESLLADGPSEIVFDFSDLTFIDSTGLAAFVMLQKRLEEQGRHLVIRSATDNARRLFDLTGLKDFFNVDP